MTKSKYTRSPPPPNSNSSHQNNNSSHQNNNSSHQNSNSSHQTANTSGFFGNMFQGMALGTGSSIGHKMVDSVFNGKKEEETKKDQSDCKDKELHIIRFNKCMKDTDNNYNMCEEILNSYFDCSQKNK
uniref:CHCH domain-containing protein n=1 Tax=viral metagenome TaxID=1070528 RepID=A0A6C0AQV6_9ZZZZ